tara:strand:- start:743 stop:1036 length:294 start_codon:yes stop_codon:yes gene_type:complete
MFNLSPDKSLKLYNLNKYSSKSLLPLLLLSFGTDDTTLHSLNVLNIGYHSYFSVSCIITDYIKNPYISRISRIGNFQFHLLAAGGMLYYLHKDNKTK